MNKRGIMRIIEASVAILIVASVLFVTYNKNVVESIPDYSENARDILEELANDISMRKDVLDDLQDFEDFEDFIQGKLPSHLTFEVKVCEVNAVCGQSSYEGNVFSAERIISTNFDSDSFEPKKIRLFLWEKE